MTRSLLEFTNPSTTKEASGMRKSDPFPSSAFGPPETPHATDLP